MVITLPAQKPHAHYIIIFSFIKVLLIKSRQWQVAEQPVILLNITRSSIFILMSFYKGSIDYREHLVWVHTGFKAWSMKIFARGSVQKRVFLILPAIPFAIPTGSHLTTLYIIPNFFAASFFHSKAALWGKMIDTLGKIKPHIFLNTHFSKLL